MLGNTITTPYDSGENHNTVFTQISAGEFSCIRKDVSGARPTVYASNTMRTSQQYSAGGKRRALIRIDKELVPTDAIPQPQPVSLYMVIEVNDNQPVGKALLLESRYELASFLDATNFAKIVNGEF